MLTEGCSKFCKTKIIYIITEGGKHALALPIANVSGEINITSNNIKKIDGKIYLNE